MCHPALVAPRHASCSTSRHHRQHPDSRRPANSLALGWWASMRLFLPCSSWGKGCPFPHSFWGGTGCVCAPQLLGAPIVLSCNAVVCWLAFHLCRERHRDRSVFPYIHEVLESCGLTLWNDLTRATHCWSDECCSMSPFSSLALGSDHFLSVFPFLVVDVQEPHRVPLARRKFPVVLDWEPVLLAARAKLDDWQAAMQELSVPDSELPQRCAIVSALFDNLVAILCDTVKSLHPTLPDVLRHRRQPRWRSGACFHALVARGEIFQGLISWKTTLSSPPVGVSSTVWFAQPAAYSGDLVKTVSPACAHAGPPGLRECIRRCFRLPDGRRTPHASTRWR